MASLSAKFRSSLMNFDRNSDYRLLWVTTIFVGTVLFELAYLLVLVWQSLEGTGLLIFVACIVGIVALQFNLLLKNHRSSGKSFVQNLFLILLSISITFVFFELGLNILQFGGESTSTHDGSNSNELVMPEELQRKNVTVAGSEWSYYWQGVLHVHKYEGFRRTTDFPAKQADTFRVLVLGDSLTYGYGINAEDTYASLIESSLSKSYQMEVLNLGVSGYQSEDVLRIAKKYLPRLQPDLVIYGMCLNDFLSSGIDEYKAKLEYQVPFPMKRVLIERTLVGQFLSDKYNALLINLGLRNDFFADIMKDLHSYQVRFASDMQSLNEFVQQQHQTPMLSMVLNQFPCRDCRSYEITQIAEKLIADSGIQLILADYIEEYADKNIQLYVNQWEGHPNETANRIFAAKLVPAIEQLPQLQPYQRRVAH